MLRSRHSLLAIASLAIAACTLGAPAALAATNATHVPHIRDAVHAEQLFPGVNVRVPNARAQQPRIHADAPFADLILG
ncbi:MULTISPECIES: hypothetical protein [unclassified Bradyrhizobium]|uniref:hypothetical protein n=1 Tax=unclassified Bradyrhizobium TaxID=2631580 RepID=UPI0012EBE21E|nr:MULTISPECIES: hypothetical protein [unclassified Bradyrhizobium]QIG98251.1 hypothetical protein G6P99_42745 [Bradyrhizobium sp. 6(2017)]